MMLKTLRALIALLILLVLTFAGYKFYQHKQEQYMMDMTKTTIVNKLESVGNLETVRIRMQKVVEGRQGLSDLFPGYAVDNIIQKFLFEDSIHMVAYADIVAGFDLHQLTTGSIIIENGTVSITLPKAIILHAALSPETKPLVRKLGVLTKGDEQLETELRNKTLEAMTVEAREKGLLDEAEKRAQDILNPLFQAMNLTLADVQIVQ